MDGSDLQIDIEGPPVAATIHEEGNSAGSLPLAALLDVCTPSARLKRMLAETTLGSTTVGEYESERDRVEAWMLEQPNCGRRSVMELRELLKLLATALPITGASNGTKPEEPVDQLLSAYRQLDRSVGEQTLDNLLVPETLSVRLGRMLNQTRLGSITLGEFLQDRAAVETWMLGQWNCGRRTVRELRDAITTRLRVELSKAEVPQSAWPSGIGVPAATLPSGAPIEEAPPADGSIQDVILWHLERLPSRTAEVLTFRFGLNCHPKTLAETGEIYSITRERIRQIEAKALDRMRAIYRRYPCDAQLDAARANFVVSVFGGASHIADDRFDKAARTLDGHISLMLELAGLSAREWFAKSAAKLGTGWLRPDIDIASVKSKAAALRAAAADRPLPRAAVEVLDDPSDEYTTAAAELLLGWHLQGSYFFQRRPRRRLLRTAGLHAILTSCDHPMELAELLSSYKAAVPTDKCSDRDLVIVMEAACHLFIETYEGCWAAVGPGGKLPERDEELPPSDEQQPRDLDDSTIAYSLEQELEKTGPLRVSQLIKRATDIIPGGRSANSVGPTLLLHPSRFVRVLPGVYALPHQVLDDRTLGQTRELEYFLNPQQARLFALARRAEEPWGSYPLWTIRAEMRLCRWARSAGHDDLLRSLLSVASIEDWPTDDADRQGWLELRSRQARFELEFRPRQRAYDIPLDRVLAAALHLRQGGTLGWMTANRILGHSPDASAAAPLLAGMIRSGIVAPPTDGSWQRPHHAGARLDEWIERMGSELHQTGELRWTGRSGLELSPAFSQMAGNEPAGEPEVEEELDEFEAMMAEHRRSLQTRRQEARLEMALDQ